MTTPERAAPPRPHGDAAWARAKIIAGAKVRKVTWGAGPCVFLDPEDPSRLLTEQIEGVTGPIPWGDIFHEHGDPGEQWELHPPPLLPSTLYAPIAWILYLFPDFGGRRAFEAVVNAIAYGGDFVDLLVDLWTKAGKPATGGAMIAALSNLDRGLFRKSLAGDVVASTEILNTLLSSKNSLTASLETPR